MATKKKMLMSAAGSAGGASLDITDVFSTYLYTGTGAAQTITNGIDLDGEGGLVWVKNRDAAYDNVLVDTERGAQETMFSNSTPAQLNRASITSFNSNGFGLGAYPSVSQNTNSHASWTFRKAPKFFDVVTYTGTGSAQNISHSLGSVPGMVIVKCTNTAKNWGVYHRGVGSTNYLQLNTTGDANINSGFWNDTDPTSTQFTLGNQSNVNGNGNTYVAYLFAHNDSGDGEFGPDGDQDIIKCGSYTEASSGDQEINLGFEPQWIMIKPTSTTGDWWMYDVMRGMSHGGSQRLKANVSDAEAVQGGYMAPTPNGFLARIAASGFFGSGVEVAYMAIRRGPLAVPEDATEVFAIDTQSQSSAPHSISNFPVDIVIRQDTTGSRTELMSRLTQGTVLIPSGTDTESSDSVSQFDFNNGVLGSSSASSTRYSFMWKRAPGYFDAVCFSGNSTAGRTVSHNLGVAPEMMWVKSRDLNGGQWVVYHSGLNVDGDGNPETDYIRLNDTAAAADNAVMWNDTAPTDSVFSLGSFSWVNYSGSDFIAYLFASVDNVSRVGSYTGNGSSQTINAGFTTGARYILIKRTDSTGDWYVWDSVRGIVSANSPHLSLNTTAAEVTSDDSIDPDSSGFIVNQVSATNINVSSADYIFYAIA